MTIQGAYSESNMQIRFPKRDFQTSQQRSRLHPHGIRKVPYGGDNFHVQDELSDQT